MIILASCQQDNPHNSRKNQKMVLRINMKEEPCWMDPRKGNDMISSQLHYMLFEGLMKLEPNLTISFAQAKSYDLSSDQKTYTFHLRDSQWTNGAPVTAYDFESSWKMILNPTFPSHDAYLIYGIKNAKKAKEGLVPLDTIGIHAKDEKTLIIELENPNSSFLHITTCSLLSPVHKDQDIQDPNWSHEAHANFLCNGPFRLKEWHHNNQIIFEKNPSYWRAEDVKLEEIHITMIANEMTALRMYASGLFDILGAHLSPFPALSYEQLSDANLLHIVPTAGTKILAYNTTVVPFNNVHIRRAFSLSIHRQDIVKNITYLKEDPAYRIIPSVLDNGKKISYIKDNDVDTAKKEFHLGLQELGIKISNFPQIYLTFWGSDRNHLLAQQLQQKWLQLFNVKVELDMTDFKTILSKTKEGDFSLALLAYIAEFSNSINIFNRFKNKDNLRNYSRWENEKYIALYEQSMIAETEEKCVEYKNQMEKILMDEMPFSPLYHYNCGFLVRPHIKNLQISPLGHILFERLIIDLPKE